MTTQGSRTGSLGPALAGGLAVLAVALFGLVNLTGRPAIRTALRARPIVGVDAFEVRSPADIRFGLDGGPATVRDMVVPYYSQRTFPLALILLSGVSFLSGFVGLIFRPADRRARLFYWLSLSFGATVM